MAVRYSAEAQTHSRTISLGAITQMTVTCWFKIANDRNTTSIVWNLGASNSDYLAFGMSSDGTTCQVFDEGAASPQAINATVGTWYFAAVATSGVNGNLWMRAAGGGAWTNVTWSNFSATTTATTLQLGRLPPTGFWADVSLAAVKIWTGVTLTLGEVELEAQRYTPARTQNLQAWYPMLTTSTVDYSGNGWTLSGGTGSTTEDGPPLMWGQQRRSLYRPAAAFQGWGVPALSPPPPTPPPPPRPPPLMSCARSRSTPRRRSPSERRTRWCVSRSARPRISTRSTCTRCCSRTAWRSSSPTRVPA